MSGNVRVPMSVPDLRKRKVRMGVNYEPTGAAHPAQVVRTEQDASGDQRVVVSVIGGLTKQEHLAGQILGIPGEQDACPIDYADAVLRECAARQAKEAPDAGA